MVFCQESLISPSWHYVSGTPWVSVAKWVSWVPNNIFMVWLTIDLLDWGFYIKVAYLKLSTNFCWLFVSLKHGTCIKRSITLITKFIQYQFFHEINRQHCPSLIFCKGFSNNLKLNKFALQTFRNQVRQFRSTAVNKSSKCLINCLFFNKTINHEHKWALFITSDEL